MRGRSPWQKLWSRATCLNYQAELVIATRTNIKTTDTHTSVHVNVRMPDIHSALYIDFYI